MHFAEKTKVFMRAVLRLEATLPIVFNQGDSD